MRTTGEDDNNVKDDDIEDNDNDGKEKQERTTTTARTMKARMTGTMARTTAMMAAMATTVAVVVARLVGEVGGKVDVVGGEVSGVTRGWWLCSLLDAYTPQESYKHVSVFWSKRVMLVVPLLNSSISILVWCSSCVSDLARTDSIFHRYGNSNKDFCD